MFFILIKFGTASPSDELRGSLNLSRLKSVASDFRKSTLQIVRFIVREKMKTSNMWDMYRAAELRKL